MRKLSNKIFEKKLKHQRRKARTNNATKYNTNLPRVIVNRSNSYIYAQAVDKQGYVLAAANDLKIKEWTKKEKAFRVWEELAKKLNENWITQVAFDRNWFIYHGRVAQLAEWLRNSGLKV